jgi:hypothetical protein
MFHPVFRGVRALMPQLHEERAMIRPYPATSTCRDRRRRGSDVPQNPQAARFWQKYNIRGPFAIYVGRIDQNKGCPELFDFFQRTRKSRRAASPSCSWDTRSCRSRAPRIRHLGFLDDADKFDGMAARISCSCRPTSRASRWWRSKRGPGKPVLANAKCEVLKGQCVRSNAGCT